MTNDAPVTPSAPTLAASAMSDQGGYVAPEKSPLLGPLTWAPILMALLAVAVILTTLLLPVVNHTINVPHGDGGACAQVAAGGDAEATVPVTCEFMEQYVTGPDALADVIPDGCSIDARRVSGPGRLFFPLECPALSAQADEDPTSVELTVDCAELADGHSYLTVNVACPFISPQVSGPTPWLFLIGSGLVLAAAVVAFFIRNVQVAAITGAVAALVGLLFFLIGMNTRVGSGREFDTETFINQRIMLEGSPGAAPIVIATCGVLIAVVGSIMFLRRRRMAGLPEY